MQLTVAGKQIDIGETLQTHMGDALVTSSPDDLAGPLPPAAAAPGRAAEPPRRLARRRARRGCRAAAVEIGNARPYVLAGAAGEDGEAADFGRRTVAARSADEDPSLTPGEAIMRNDPEEPRQPLAGKSAPRGPGVMRRPRDGNIDCIDPRGIRGTL